MKPLRTAAQRGGILAAALALLAPLAGAQAATTLRVANAALPTGQVSATKAALNTLAQSFAPSFAESFASPSCRSA